MASLKLDDNLFFETRKGPKKTKVQGQSARQSIRKLRGDMEAQKSHSLHRREELRTAQRPQRGAQGIENYELEGVTKNYENVDIPEEELKHAQRAKTVLRTTEKAARKGVSITPRQVAGRLAKLAGKVGRRLPMMGPIGIFGQYQEFREGMHRMKGDSLREKRI